MIAHTALTQVLQVPETINRSTNYFQNFAQLEICTCPWLTKGLGKKRSLSVTKRLLNDNLVRFLLPTHPRTVGWYFREKRHDGSIFRSNIDIWKVVPETRSICAWINNENVSGTKVSGSCWTRLASEINDRWKSWRRRTSSGLEDGRVG